MVLSRRTGSLDSSNALMSCSTQLHIPVLASSCLTLIPIQTLHAIRKTANRRSETSTYVDTRREVGLKSSRVHLASRTGESIASLSSL